ncbi:MAG: bifunctional folylpolyglutamate synthase/dihydrofolate synthase [Sphaerochaetaceae bacterium]|jgi:dihydrofolate synthase/folylpolyglutamate synthase
MQFTTFDQFCNYAESFTNLERQNSNYTVRNYRLDRMEKLLSHLGNPQNNYKTIHIAGSKGKGSTANLLSNALRAIGYKTALYTSPHLVDYRERFTLSGQFFGEQELLDVSNLLVEKLQEFTFTDKWGTSKPTTFELLTSFAFLLFSETKCDWAIIETGLGGRLDATNVIKPQATILTWIELEHMAILGNTIEQIATEKSKIIKANTPVFISHQNPISRKIFYEEAKSNNCPIYDLENEVESIVTNTTFEGEKVFITWSDKTTTNLVLSMLGKAQSENVALALLTLKKLNLYKPEITEHGLEKAKMRGRMEILATNPTLLIDGAHTVESLKTLTKSFVQLFGTKDNTLIYGSLEDKDHIHMAELILPIFKTIIVSTPGTFKKSNPDSLYSLLVTESKKLQNPPTIILEKEPLKALQLALELTPKEKAILSTGSFYMGGEIVKSYRELNLEKACP